LLLVVIFGLGAGLLIHTFRGGPDSGSSAGGTAGPAQNGALRGGPSGGAGAGQADTEPAETVRYIIARSPALGKNLYYLTDEAFEVGEHAVDSVTGERVEVLAAVECLKDALPPEADTTRYAGRKTR